MNFRWKETSTWDEINCIKEIICEPRRSDMFEETISKFYENIKLAQAATQLVHTNIRVLFKKILFIGLINYFFYFLL